MSVEQRTRIVAALVEGNSVRSTCRMTGAAKDTVLELIVDLGTACRAWQDEHMRDLPCRRIQCDEVWSFVHAKDKNLPEHLKDDPTVGSVWTWTAIDADSKLIAAWHLGTRDAECALEFMCDLSARLKYRVQLTTDGHKAYLGAVEQAFGNDIDYAMLVKIYGQGPEGVARYSPPECIGARKEEVTGQPDRKHVSTSYVERENLTIRMSNRRFTRLTKAFSKKCENHGHMLAISFQHYNFARIHQTLRMTQAMAAGIASRVWDIENIVRLAE